MAFSYTAARKLVTENKTRQLRWANDEQREIFNYGPYPICASGGFGSGKTVGFCLKAAWLSDVFPNNRGVIARRTWTDLKKTTMPTFFKHVPSAAYSFGGRRSDTDKELVLNNGSTILWMHLDDPETRDIIKGLEINWFLIDQAEDVEEGIFDLLEQRLGRWDQAEVPEWVLDWYGGWEKWPHWFKDEEGNPTRPAPPSYGMLTCNPDHELHWIYRRFHPESPEKFLPLGPGGKSYHDMGYHMVTMDSRTNRFLSEKNQELLVNKDESYVRRFVRGEWGFPEGRIHTIPPESRIPGDPKFVEKLARTCVLHRTLDHGESAPTCCLWFCIDVNGNMFFYREYYMPKTLIQDHRENIYQLSRFVGPGGELTLESYVFQLADPSIFIPMQQKWGGRWSVADEYQDSVHFPQHNAIFWQPADNNELGTRDRINEFLKVEPDRIHPYTGKPGAPRVFFVEASLDYPHGCNHAIRETMSQRREKIGTAMGKPVYSDERDKKIVDHAYDCVRYAIAARAPQAAAERAKVHPNSFQEVRKRAEKAAIRARSDMQTRLRALRRTRRVH